MEDLGRVVDALVAVRPQTLSVAQLQASVAGVLPLVDRLGGWVDVALGELAVRAGGQVPAADGSGRAVPVQAWLRDATLCGGSAAGAQVGWPGCSGSYRRSPSLLAHQPDRPATTTRAARMSRQVPER